MRLTKDVCRSHSILFPAKHCSGAPRYGDTQRQNNVFVLTDFLAAFRGLDFFAFDLPFPLDFAGIITLLLMRMTLELRILSKPLVSNSARILFFGEMGKRKMR